MSAFRSQVSLTLRKPGFWGYLLLSTLGMLVLAGIALILLGLVMFGRILDSEPSRYAASVSLEGYQIEVEMVSIHPFLAEYKKHIRIRKDQQLLGEKELIDGGGFVDLYFLRDGENIHIVDGMLSGLTLDTANAHIRDLDTDRLPLDISIDNLGQIGFAEQAPTTYRWQAARELLQVPAGNGALTKASAATP
ncbi:hypothetical protein ACO0LF_18470 [Undibacterium sp. Di27W]|uniref:hypothetical protein n=1 Tax=Undibacterium sp. Di27W TaxID=3413036 RepID=UPI003BF0E7E4